MGPASQVGRRHRQQAKDSPSIYQYAGVEWEGIFTTNEGIAEMTASCGGGDPSVITPPSNGTLLFSFGKNHEDEIHYHPFRMTPYLVKVPEQQGAESQLCCVLLAERVHSGYEGDSQAQASQGLLWCLSYSPGSDVMSVR